MHIVDKNGLKGKENIEVEGLIPVGYNIQSIHIKNYKTLMNCIAPLGRGYLSEDSKRFR